MTKYRQEFKKNVSKSLRRWEARQYLKSLGALFLIVCSFSSATSSIAQEAVVGKRHANQSDSGCSPGWRPTGCGSPYMRCVRGAIGDSTHAGLSSCREMGVRNYCSNFTWEKCCVATCAQRFRQMSRTMQIDEKSPDECIGACMTAAEANIYQPKALKKN